MTAQRRPARAPAREREAAPSRPGFPIALKYALATGALLIVFMIILGVFLYRAAGARVNAEINDKGIKLAHAIASVVEPYWVIADYSDEQKALARKKLESSLNEFLRRGEGGLINIIVFPADKMRGFEASAQVQQNIGLSMDELPDETAAAQGVRIRKGTTEGKAVRSYEVALRRQDANVGWAEVFLSADAVDSTYAELRATAIFVVFVAAVIGVLVAVLVGGFLTRPVRVLKEDMQKVTAGDYAHQSVIRTGDELQQLAHAFNKMTRHLAEARDQESSRKALERELSIATTIQTSLLPDRIPQFPGYEISTHYASAKEVGGDYYDFIDLGGYHHAIIVADVSGKGIPGSLVMTMTRSLVRMAARETTDPAQILNRVNATLSKDMTRGMFVTLTLVDLDHARDVMRVARAGHNAAYVYRAAEQKLIAVQPDGIALGMDKGPLFNSTLKVETLDLTPGDFVVLYTDGIVEAMDPDGKEYTAQRFEQRLLEAKDGSAREIVDRVISDVDAHSAGGEASDDITLVVILRRRSGEKDLDL